MSSSRKKLASPAGYGATGSSTATSDGVFTNMYQEEGKDHSKSAPGFGNPRTDHHQPGSDY